MLSFDTKGHTLALQLSTMMKHFVSLGKVGGRAVRSQKEGENIVGKGLENSK